jgi:hypothetical protein
MADQSEQLRLQASIDTSKFGPQLRDMQRSLRALAADTKITHQAGVKFSRDHAEALNELRTQFQKAGGMAREVFTPALGAIGISAFGAAEGIKKVVEAVKGFGDSTQTLTFLSKQTGLTINQLRLWQEEATRVGTSAESMTRGFVTFNEQMSRMQRLGPMGPLRELRDVVQSSGINRNIEPLRRLIDSLQGQSRESQLEKILRFVDTIPADQGRKVLQAFGLDPALANKSSAEIKADIESIHKRLGDLSAESVKKGNAAKEAFDDLAASIHNLSDTIGADLAPAMTKIIAQTSSFVADAGKIKEIFSGAQWSKFGDDLKVVSGTANDLVEKFSSWSTILKEIVQLQFKPLTDAMAGLRLVIDAINSLRSGGGGGQNRQPIPPLPPEFFRQNYRPPAGGGARLMPAGYRVEGGVNPLLEGGGASSPAERILEGAVRKGVYDGMLDFLRGQPGGARAGGGATLANFSPGGAGGAGGGGGLGGFSGGAPGGPGTPNAEETIGSAGIPKPKLSGLTTGGVWAAITGGRGGGRPAHLENIRQALAPVGGRGGKYSLGDIRSSVMGSESATATGGGSPYLARERAPLAAEYAKMSPAQKAEMGAAMHMENNKDPSAVFEALANRALAEKGRRPNVPGTLTRGLHNSFYSTVNSGAARAAGNRYLKEIEGYAPKIFGGQDILEGRTDQGMLSDPGSPRTPAEAIRRRLKLIHGEHFSDKLGTEAYVRADRQRKAAYDATEHSRTAGAKPDPGAGHYSMTGRAVPLQQGGIVTKPTHALLGEHGPEAVIPLRARGFISAIGRTETDFDPREAYSERLNKPWNNANVKDLIHAHRKAFGYAGARSGQAGRDYGYFQGGEQIVQDAIRRGVSPEIAKYMAGSGGPQTLGKQMIAMNEYVKRRWPEQYQDLVAHGNFEGMRKAAQGTWFGLKDHPDKAKQEFEASSRSPRNLLHHARQAGLVGQPLQHKVTGDANITVDFRGMPKGVVPGAKASGMFKQVRMNRGHAAAPASMEG